MSRNSPRLTNVMYLIAALEEVVRRYGSDTKHPESFHGTRLTIVYISLVMRRHFGIKPLGWPNHMLKFNSLLVQVGFMQRFWLEWEIGNDLPEDELLVELRTRLVHYMTYAERNSDRPVGLYEMIDHELHTCVRDHLKRIRIEDHPKAKFDELLADKGPTRDYFNIQTVQGAVTE